MGAGRAVKASVVGLRAVRVEVGSPAEALDLAAVIRRSALEVDEVVPGARTVLLDGVEDPAALIGMLPRLVTSLLSEAAAGRMVELPTTYDGEDLTRVADLWRCSVEEVVARHTALTFTSAFCGFAPGFAYLTGLPPELQVPRLTEPRVRVPAGSVAMAGEWCGVYPVASPGGWLLLGHTDATLWDPDSETPAVLAPGTRVRFSVHG
ncbi:5-oxoprolinase subunit B family protein [Nocardioides sp. Kera G14]|uniref:5-oxoprolinase subunit B family protein n=1 Tax=Nocardioides sp. Kera G14 TaxID=2884264 RepID=UPI001D1165BB|nr:allophanate hydrolase subunit 1 [Nocardioides sp. Kera G14]UDY22410.1 allophanate hydrolase subunit 1 [Nocardioides sp. Kera G14]